MKRTGTIARYELTDAEFLKLINREGEVKFLMRYGSKIVIEVLEDKYSSEVSG